MTFNDLSNVPEKQEEVCFHWFDLKEVEEKSEGADGVEVVATEKEGLLKAKLLSFQFIDEDTVKIYDPRYGAAFPKLREGEPDPDGKYKKPEMILKGVREEVRNILKADSPIKEKGQEKACSLNAQDFYNFFIEPCNWLWDLTDVLALNYVVKGINTEEDSLQAGLRLSKQIRRVDRKSTRLNSSHTRPSRMPSSA